MRQDLRPQLQVRCCLEDFHLRCANDNGIGFMHEQIETAQSFNVARLLPNTASFLENLGQERGKSLRGSQGSITNPMIIASSHRALITAEAPNGRLFGATVRDVSTDLTAQPQSRVAASASCASCFM